jgi:hypothetical protein
LTLDPASIKTTLPFTENNLGVLVYSRKVGAFLGFSFFHDLVIRPSGGKIVDKFVHV